MDIGTLIIKIFPDGPSMVYVNVFVRSFSKIDGVKMVSYMRRIMYPSNTIFWEYSFQITLRQQWNDKRLRFKEKLAEMGVGESKGLMNSKTKLDKFFLFR
jgi:hypothetical protein